ncbi:MAG TPA: PEP/pyruvate-binding domain-containing protein [Myxococcota bacterium]|nr:PEP/pyruvate-binding domain-containing protein [Myxococcota bacterium]HRY96500.1 PEP/pyruvate-binding domain-containing protein [Myxococcota bacterium]HSA21961.1 PEP/pyruvate-binding domain-containing protein [Myxococcota bacterium]
MPRRLHWTAFLVTGALCALVPGCSEAGGGEPIAWECQLPAGDPPDYLSALGCEDDFLALASIPADSSIPGARSVKTVIDREDGDALYFQNSQRYAIHWEFARAVLSGGSLPYVPELGEFNTSEYYKPTRRFLLGAVTHYEGAGAWVYEIAPYDTAEADFIARAYRAIATHACFGAELRFHPTSDDVAHNAADLPSTVEVITTDELYAGIDYQPLNLGTALGRLRFITAAELEIEYVSYRDIVVLDNVPNDISVVMGIITAAFQTPLSHVNVLSQNRNTPNMGLRGAWDDPALRALEGKWVRLHVTGFDWSVEEVTQEEADTWWEENKPAAVQVPDLDLTVTDLRDVQDVLDPALSLGDGLDGAIPAFGGKASHYGAISNIGDPVVVPAGFVIPVSFYWQFMEQNGFRARIEALLEDPEFAGDPELRKERLAELRADMLAAPIDPVALGQIDAKLTRDFPGLRMRFRSSTNAEDLDGFTGAGLYISWTGAQGDASAPIEDAIRTVWSSVWFFRAFEERTYRSIDHHRVGMAVLVMTCFSDEEANGVALTANMYDTSGLEPGFYINAQRGGESVVKPRPGVTSDQFIYHHTFPGQPTVFIAHSNLVPEGCTVLTRNQTHELGLALDAVHAYFQELYGSNPDGYYAMDVEWKFDAPPGEEPRLYIKQARPHSGWAE